MKRDKPNRPLNRPFTGRPVQPRINERAHSSSVASGRGKIADEALRKFSWESDSDQTE